MTRRPGLSLTEVLVALFIMGIGTIAILTLFPLGAMNMASALRDNRTAQCAQQSDAYLRAYVKDRGAAIKNESWYTALDDPGYKTVSKYLIPFSSTGISPASSRGQPSYAVVIDPMGHIARFGVSDAAPAAGNKGSACWVGDGGFGNGDPERDRTALSRHTLAVVYDKSKIPVKELQSQFALRTCTLLDGMGYDKSSGAPQLDATSNTIDRDVRYNWLWVLQKPEAISSPPQVAVKVVVFDRRAPMYAPPGSETVYVPNSDQTTPHSQPGLTLVRFPAGQAPPVQRGGWLLDATVVARESATGKLINPSNSDTFGPITGHLAWVRNANFYRVVSVTENATDNTIDIELETPLLADVTPTLNGGFGGTLPAQYRRFVYLNGVVEVFERPPLTLPR